MPRSEVCTAKRVHQLERRWTVDILSSMLIAFFLCLYNMRRPESPGAFVDHLIYKYNYTHNYNFTGTITISRFSYSPRPCNLNTGGE